MDSVEQVAAVLCLCLDGANYLRKSILGHTHGWKLAYAADLTPVLEKPLQMKGPLIWLLCDCC